MSHTTFETVNNLEFVTRDGGERFALGYTAKVTIKVGNIIKEISIYKDKNSIEGETSVSLGELKTLEDAGMKFDFTELIKEYDDTLPKMIAKEADMKLIRYRKAYTDSWVVVQDLATLKPTQPGVVFKVETMEGFVERCIKSSTISLVPQFSILYRAQEVFVSFINVSNERYRYNSSNADFKYQIYFKLTDYKRRNYAKLETAITKVVKLIDEAIAKGQRKMKQAAENQKAREEKLAMYRKEFATIKGVTILESKEYQSSPYTKSQGHTVYKYYIVKKVEGSDINRRMSIQHCNTTGEVKTFHFAGMGVLTSKQIQQILQVV